MTYGGNQQIPAIFLLQLLAKSAKFFTMNAKQKSHRYKVRDARLGQCTYLTGKLATPWQVIDTANNIMIDEYTSKLAASRHARDLNEIDQTFGRIS